MRNAVLTAIVGLVMPVAVEAACTAIAAVPFTAQSPGEYCLARSLQLAAASGAALSVAADGVTIDLAGHVLENTAGPSTLAYGIHSMNRRGVVVRNGTVKGFYLGILIDGNSLEASRDHLVERVTVRDCTYTGIQMEGANMILRDSVVRDIGGPTGHHPNGVVACENGNAGSIQALNNVVDNIFPLSDEQSPDGMMLECNESLVVGNRVRHVDDQALAVRGGVCRDNILQMVANRPYEAVKGSGGCTFLGKGNFSYP